MFARVRHPLVRGVTLLEIVFASFIFSGLVTVLSGMWVMHARAQRQTGQYLVAADLADLEMSRALGQGYYDIVPSSATYTQEWTVRGQTVKHVYTSKVDVILLEKESSEDLAMKQIRVTVSYPDGATAKKSFVIESVIGDDS